MKYRKEEFLKTAIEMYSKNVSIKEISEHLSIPQAVLSQWRSECRGTSLDWDGKRRQVKPVNVHEWFDRAVDRMLRYLGEDPEQWTEDTLKMLDQLLSSKKKYEGDRDIMGETKRVARDMALFIKREFPEKTKEFAEILEQFMLSVEG